MIGKRKAASPGRGEAAKHNTHCTNIRQCLKNRQVLFLAVLILAPYITSAALLLAVVINRVVA